MIKIYFSLLSHVGRLDPAVHLVEEELQGEEATTGEGAAKGSNDLATDSSRHKQRNNFKMIHFWSYSNVCFIMFFAPISLTDLTDSRDI